MASVKNEKKGYWVETVKKDKSSKTNNTDFHNKIEGILQPVSIPIEKLSDTEVRKLAHELEMQNEELRKSQQVLEDSREKYSNLYDIAPVGYFTISDKGIILEVNLTGADMLGMERSFLISKPLNLFIMKEDLGIYYLEHTRLCKTGGRGICELRIEREDGTQFFARLECTAVLGTEGDSTLCMTIISDITRQKHVEDKLRTLFHAINQSSSMIVITNTEGNIEYTNPKFTETTGYTTEEAIGKTLRILKSGKTSPEVYEELWKTIHAGNEWKGELCNKKKNGELYWELDSISPVKDDLGAITNFIAVKDDITRRKKLEAALLQSEKLKSIGIITAGISHEFNNILNIISGNVQLLQMDYKGHHKLMDRLRTIEESVDNGSSITGRMREFTHPDTPAVDFEPADINALIEESVKFTMPRWKNMAQIKGLDYNVNMEGMKSVSSILCNHRDLEGVFVNIINNALDAMPDGGTLSFRTWSKDDTVFASITDTGKGMTDDVMKNIFDPFFTTRRPEGTGLGLSTSYTKIVNCGGTIEVDSEVGKGCTFTLQFPLTNKNENPIIVPDTKQETIEKSLSILVVDDEDAIRDMLKIFLSKKGYNVKAVDNGTDAINMIEGEEFDLVLSDLSIPQVNGYEVIKACNKLGKRPKTCIMTGLDEELKLVADGNSKVDFILRKPFKLQELSKHIDDLLGADGK